ncbi:microtubule-actin cross-linking factor isoforms 1 2 3 5-like [Limosa lapponica baueri]|uniref:Microtubule-actin cross-linking factor isoforms 1 2 3 5-like n=1 Tax=Limosa lapponica baueri TaxID=1758121 RepID=A0A2I0T395_LIMLA|nr:microtubule-actin cross-linking factor isoforms 1 2 3 5-like [Limosa lapponica baueri]
MESLRMRYLIVGQSSADTMHRLGQTLEASSRLGTGQEDLALWLGRMEKELASWDSQPGHQEPPVSDSDREKFEQILDSQLAHLAGLGQRLEEIGHVQLDAQALRSQLSDQKLLSAEILHHRGLAERLLGVSDPLLCSCPEPLRLRLQPSVQALRERTEQLFLRSGACAVQLEHAQSLLAQFTEALQELSPWLEETQLLGEQLSPEAISYEAFKEQQALLQHQLEAALLGLGQFHHQLEELLQWLHRAAEQLQGPAMLRPDLQSCEIELAKHKLYCSWHSLNKVWTERYSRLQEQLQAALSYQETMQRVFEWLDAAELRMAEEFLVGGDLDMVQQQLAELKEELGNQVPVPSCARLS